MTNKKIISKIKKEKILKKAAQLFWESGYKNTTTKDLSKAIGIQGPGFYHYFKNKEEVLLEILEFGELKFQEDVIDQLKKVDNPEEKIKTLIRNIIRLLSKSGEIPLLFDSIDPCDNVSIQLARATSSFTSVQSIPATGTIHCQSVVDASTGKSHRPDDHLRAFTTLHACHRSFSKFRQHFMLQLPAIDRFLFHGRDYT